MENELLAYVKGILCFVLFSGLLIQLFPRTKDKKYLELTIGLIFLYLIMKPVLSSILDYDKIMDSSYFNVELDSEFLAGQQEKFEIQIGVAMMNNIEKQMETMGYENPGLTMKKNENVWVLFVEVEQNLSENWEEEKKNLKNFISNVYNLDEDNINIEIRG